MSGFKQRHGIREVGTRRNANASHLRSQRVGQIVTVQVQRGDHAVISGASQHLLQHRVGDHILDHNVAAGARILDAHPGTTIQQFTTEFCLSQLVAPITEGALCELHDVALVHQRNRRQILINRVLDRLAHQALGALRRDRLDTNAHILWEADLGGAHLLDDEVDDLLRFVGARLVLDAGVDVFRVLPEDHHIAITRVLDRRRNAFEPPYGSQAGVKIQFLA